MQNDKQICYLYKKKFVYPVLSLVGYYIKFFLQKSDDVEELQVPVNATEKNDTLRMLQFSHHFFAQ